MLNYLNHLKKKNISVSEKEEGEKFIFSLLV
jgi:hypothetical protein